MKPQLLALSLSLALAACSAPDDAAQAPAATATTSDGTTEVAADAATELDALFAGYWEESLALNPLQATFVGDPRYNHLLPDTLSAEFRRKTHEFNERWLQRALEFDGTRLDAQAQLSHEIFVRRLRRELEGERFPGWMQPLNQFRSLASMLAQLGSGKGAQPFRTVQDYDNWLSRAGNVPQLFDTAIGNMREGIAKGVVQPKVLMQKVLPQLDALIRPGAEETLFWEPLRNLPESFSEDDRIRITAAYRDLVDDTLLPSYRKLRDFIADEYLPAARDSVGLAELPDGAEWYAFNVRSITTTDLTPGRIHEIGLDEVARIHGEMRGVMEQVGFEGTLKDFFAFMTTDNRFEFESEQALLDTYNAFRARVNQGVAPLFSLTPRAAFEIRPVEPFRAASAAGGSYQRPSDDGTRPGIFYVNTYDLPSRKTWDMESLFLHEAIPGHHFQIALQQELTGLPKFRRFGGETAFTEGWGLYAESLGRELGVYTDPYQYFGRLQAELWRAIRLVVDTGLHAKGWTREQVIDYMLENSATTQTEAVSETERYIAIPGQALAYKIGELKIRELRSRAEKALGDGFDIRAFHAEVLKDGAVPLDVLEQKIERWISTQG